MVYYYLQDANYNVVGITDESGNVVRQYTWTPYGELAATEDPAGTPPLVSRVGHQGLFFERFYADPSESLLDDPALSPVDVHGGTEVLGCYHNRNRWYSPELGRFISRDPNRTGLLCLAPIRHNGEAPELGSFRVNVKLHFADGLDLYLALGANPIRKLDPLALMTMGDLLSSGATWGNRFASMADVGGQVKDAVSALVAGASLSNVLLGVALNIAVDQAGGKLLDSFAAIGKMRNALNRRTAESFLPSGGGFTKNTYRRYNKKMYGDLPSNWQVQHNFPREHVGWFSSLDPPINIDDPLFTVGMPRELHGWMHNSFGWNRKWDKFIRERSDGATHDLVFQFLADLYNEAAHSARQHFGG